MEYSRLLDRLNRAILCYFSYTWAVQLIREVFHFELSFICWSGVFIAEEADGIGDKVSAYTTVAVWTNLEAFLNMSLRSASNVKPFNWQTAKLLVLGLLSSTELY
jgi:hypothetical protein